MKRFDASVERTGIPEQAAGIALGNNADLQPAVPNETNAPGPEVCEQSQIRCAPARLQGRSELEIRREERCRIGRELHDSTSQLLVALQLRLARFKEKLGEAEYCAALPDVDAAIDELHQEIRALMSSDTALPLRAGELPGAVQAMAARFAETTGLNISVELDDDHSVRSAEVESSLYRIAQEALANVWRHARATSAAVKLRSRQGCWQVTIEDDGIGIAGEKTRRMSNGIGLDNIRQRVQQLGGRLYVRRLRHGTRVTVVTSPLPAAVLFARQ